MERSDPVFLLKCHLVFLPTKYHLICNGSDPVFLPNQKSISAQPKSISAHPNATLQCIVPPCISTNPMGSSIIDITFWIWAQISWEKWGKSEKLEWAQVVTSIWARLKKWAKASPRAEERLRPLSGFPHKRWLASEQAGQGSKQAYWHRAPAGLI